MKIKFITGIKNNQGLLVILLSVFALVVLAPAMADKKGSKEKPVTASSDSSLLSIAPYKKSSFAPARGETFIMPVKIVEAEKIKKINIEIRTSDNDLVRTLSLNKFKSDKTHYNIVWDGKDNNKQLVPDEVYYPVFIITDRDENVVRLDRRTQSGGEEVYDFEKVIRPGAIEYTLPVASRVLIRSGIKNGPMLRTIIDWEPRTAGFHADRWNGRDEDNIIAIEQNPHVGYLIMGYQLPDYSILAYGNEKDTYRAYRKRQKWPLRQAHFNNRLLERGGHVIRPEFYTPISQQKSPRISVNMLDRTSRKSITRVKGFDELVTEVKLHPLDEIYLDQERYEISFFVDNEFIAEEEQGYVPFTWRWSPGRFGLKPGDHVLTVNVSGYNGQVGVKNIMFSLEKDKHK